jgi:hypothetical protein
MESFKAFCAICEKELQFESSDDYWSCRGSLRSTACGYGSCATRERAIGSALLGMVPREALQNKIISDFLIRAHLDLAHLSVSRSGICRDFT